MRPNTLCASVMILAVGACASAGSGATPVSTTGSAAPTSSELSRRDPNVITRQELADPSFSSLNVYDVIASLRPRFLSTRGNQNIQMNGRDPESGQIHVSIDDSGLVPLDELKRIPVRGVAEIRWLSPAAAMQRFGSTAKSGAVITVRTM